MEERQRQFSTCIPLSSDAFSSKTRDLYKSLLLEQRTKYTKTIMSL